MSDTIKPSAIHYVRFVNINWHIRMMSPKVFLSQLKFMGTIDYMRGARVDFDCAANRQLRSAVHLNVTIIHVT